MEYRVNEGVLALVDEFSIFVKGGSLGTAPTLSGLPGSIRSDAVTAKGGFCGILYIVVIACFEVLCPDYSTRRAWLRGPIQHSASPCAVLWAQDHGL